MSISPLYALLGTTVLPAAQDAISVVADKLDFAGLLTRGAATEPASATEPDKSDAELASSRDSESLSGPLHSVVARILDRLKSAHPNLAQLDSHSIRVRADGLGGLFVDAPPQQRAQWEHQLNQDPQLVDDLYALIALVSQAGSPEALSQVDGLRVASSDDSTVPGLAGVAITDVELTLDTERIGLTAR